MDTGVNSKEMMVWFDNHKEEHLGTTGFKKRRSPIPMKETSKERAWAQKKDITYGEQSRSPIANTYHINGHEIQLHDDGILTCDCKGWIFKRAGQARECKHVREIYGRLHKKAIPEKSVKIDKEDVIRKVAEEVRTLIKLIRGKQAVTAIVTNQTNQRRF